jgi:hypothetical protein
MEHTLSYGQSNNTSSPNNNKECSMPNYKGHLVGGLVAFGVMCLFLYPMHAQIMVIGEWLLCALAGALFPDVDTKSKGQKYFYRIMCILTLYVIIKRNYSLLAVISIFSLLPLIVRHRGIFHELWFILCIVCGTWIFGSMYIPYASVQLFYDLIFFMAGVISHLWLDVGFKKVLIP